MVHCAKSVNHRRHLANKMGEGQNRPWVLGSVIYERVKPERREEWFQPPLSPTFFLFAPLQLSSQRNLLLGRKKYWRGRLAPPPKLRLCMGL